MIRVAAGGWWDDCVEGGKGKGKTDGQTDGWNGRLPGVTVSVHLSIYSFCV